MSKKIFLNDDNLRAEIYLIGYPKMGESQLVLLRDKSSGKIYFSAVIDSYTHDSVNKTIELLNLHSVKQLNLLCWTHPDKDHSIGIDTIFNDFCSNDTLVLLPEGVNGSATDFLDYEANILDFFSAIKNNNSGRKYNVDSASAVREQTKGVVTRLFTLGLKEIKFQIDAVAPIGAIVRRRMENGLSVKNDISIALILKFGECSFFFSGDIENQTISLLPEHIFSNLSYLKTPHHTSKTSDGILKILESTYDGEYKIPITCTTAYRKHFLPNEKLIEKYRLYTSSFFTTHNDSSPENYGIIKAVFNPFDNTFEYYLFGSSRKIY